MIALEVAGVLLMLVSPGLAWSFVFLGWKDVGLTGRLAIGVGLSIVIVPSTSFFLNLGFGMPITALSTSLVAVAATLVALGYLALRSDRLAPVVRRMWPDS